MKLRILGASVVTVALWLWVQTFVLADRWMDHLRVVNDDPWGYYWIGMLPIFVPIGILAVVGLWFLGPVVGQAIVDWLRK